MNVAFIIFRRPELTARVFERIRQARPDKLFLIADGPKTEADRERCRQARTVVETIDWPCEVFRNYSEMNLGLKRRVSSGLDWVFSGVEDAIILEDDCLPDPSFFPYCMELLERYRADTRIMHIGGTNPLDGFPRTPYSYFYSKYTHCWGWATWKRAWTCFDVEMNLWRETDKEAFLASACAERDERTYWRKMFDSVSEGRFDSWATGWLFACWARSGLAVLPAVSLVSNIGFGREGTHTTNAGDRLANRPAGHLHDLKHPPSVVRDGEADRRTFQEVFSWKPDFFTRAKGTLLNRHWYGAFLRKTPLIGPMWAGWRKSRERVS